MVDERVWLRHGESGGYFHCPAGAVEFWTTPEMGWQVSDPPPEQPSPVVAELLAWQAEQAAQRDQAADEPTEPEQKSITATAGPRPETEE